MLRSRAVGAARWIGLAGGPELAGEVVVVSPHLDDAAFSLGASISRAARRGARVTVITVLGGKLDSDAPAGDWDARAGFATEGEAARRRRAEDASAFELLGARRVLLPYSDNQYERGGTDDEIRNAVVDAARSGLVLLPGFPLEHDDHRWVHELLRSSFGPARTGFYVEQPYAVWAAQPPPAGWQPLRAGAIDRRRKRAACRAYATQLELLEQPLGPMVRYELRQGGEAASLP
jgi:LmbE family N-acetylglucosaminyl deacetylase